MSGHMQLYLRSEQINRVKNVLKYKYFSPASFILRAFIVTLIQNVYNLSLIYMNILFFKEVY